MEKPPKKLLEQVSDVIRLKHYSYKEVLKQELDLKVDAIRAKRSKYLPTVLTKEEVLAIYPHWFCFPSPNKSTFFIESDCFTISYKHLHMHPLIVFL